MHIEILRKGDQKIRVKKIERRMEKEVKERLQEIKDDLRKVYLKTLDFKKVNLFIIL